MGAHRFEHPPEVTPEVTPGAASDIAPSGHSGLEQLQRLLSEPRSDRSATGIADALVDTPASVRETMIGPLQHVLGMALFQEVMAILPSRILERDPQRRDPRFAGLRRYATGVDGASENNPMGHVWVAVEGPNGTALQFNFGMGGWDENGSVFDFSLKVIAGLGHVPGEVHLVPFASWNALRTAGAQFFVFQSPAEMVERITARMRHDVASPPTWGPFDRNCGGSCPVCGRWGEQRVRRHRDVDHPSECGGRGGREAVPGSSGLHPDPTRREVRTVTLAGPVTAPAWS